MTRWQRNAKWTYLAAWLALAACSKQEPAAAANAPQAEAKVEAPATPAAPAAEAQAAQAAAPAPPATPPPSTGPMQLAEGAAGEWNPQRAYADEPADPPAPGMPPVEEVAQPELEAAPAQGSGGEKKRERPRRREPLRAAGVPEDATLDSTGPRREQAKAAHRPAQAPAAAAPAPTAPARPRAPSAEPAGADEAETPYLGDVGKQGDIAIARPQHGLGTSGTGIGGGGFGRIHGGRIGYAVRRDWQPHSDRQFRPLPPPPAFYPRDARYRANYLPGRGYLEHLGGFLGRARGVASTLNLQLAATPRTPDLPAPTSRALDVAVDQLHGQLPPEGGTTTLRLRLRAADAPPRSRAPVRLHLVLDGSGSMKGAPWRHVCAAVTDAAGRLGPDDRMSVTVYQTAARVLSAPVPGGADARQVAETVCRLTPRGETNIHDGLRLGYEQAQGAYTPHAVNRVVLLSDGMATVGPRDLYSLTVPTVAALGQGITTSTVGMGNDFDALLMGRVALEGGGNQHYVREAAAVSGIFADELDVLAREAAQAVEVRVRLADDVELVEVVGSEPLTEAESQRVRQAELDTDARLQQERGIAANRQRDEQGGVRFLLPSFRLGDEHTLLLVVRVPAGQGTRPLAQIELKYKDMLGQRNVALAGSRHAVYAETPADAEAARVQAVAVAEARARAALALQRASEYLHPANLPGVQRELYAASGGLRAVADATGSAPLHAEARRVHALADAARLTHSQPQMAYLTAALHYSWRHCGVTAW